jgi:hypothetical protein
LLYGGTLVWNSQDHLCRPTQAAQSDDEELKVSEPLGVKLPDPRTPVELAQIAYPTLTTPEWDECRVR